MSWDLRSVSNQRRHLSMLLAIAFFVGLGVGFVANRWRSWAGKAKPESPENKAPEQSAPAVVAISSEPSDLTTRLQPLRVGAGL
jgi:hypothetical protein